MTAQKRVQNFMVTVTSPLQLLYLVATWATSNSETCNSCDVGCSSLQMEKSHNFQFLTKVSEPRTKHKASFLIYLYVLNLLTQKFLIFYNFVL